MRRVFIQVIQRVPSTQPHLELILDVLIVWHGPIFSHPKSIQYFWDGGLVVFGSPQRGLS